MLDPAVYYTNLTQEKQLKGSTFFTEISAGLTTFFTMAYIIAVNVSTDLSYLELMTLSNVVTGYRLITKWRDLRVPEQDGPVMFDRPRLCLVYSW